MINTRTSFSQATNELTRDERRQRWLVEQQLRQYDFLKSFKTKKYICEEKHNVRIEYDIKNKKWRVINDDVLEIIIDGKKISEGKRREIWTIYKSEDIKNEVERGRISHCGVNDLPVSDDQYLNNYFCIVSQSSFLETHQKCLLEIKEDYDKRGTFVHTLVCGNAKSTKFNLTYRKVFQHNFIISEFSSDSLSHGMVVKDCQEFGN